MSHTRSLLNSLSAVSASDESPLSRRRFVGLSLAGVAGTLIPFQSASADDAHLINPVILYVGRLAMAIGTGLVSNSIYDYIRSRPSVRNRVEAVNSDMRSNGFTNFGAARVYARSDHFFYPVIWRDGFNACAAFLNNDGGRTNVAAVVEGPTLVGMALAAEEYSQQFGTTTARRVFQPEQIQSRSRGAFEASYTSPDVFRTQVGEVRMDYRTEGPGQGRVVVLAREEVNPSRWSNLFTAEYPIQYAA